FKNTTDVYVNSGFVGIAREHRDFLATWQKILQIMQPRIPNLAAAHNAGRTYPFWRWEQDGLNIAMACMDTPISLINREGMDFAGRGCGCYLAHWSGRPNPWSTQLTARALQGYPPKERDRMYLHHTRSPINVYSPWQRWLKRLDLNCATAISRF